MKVGERAPYAQRYGREDYKDLAEDYRWYPDGEQVGTDKRGHSE